MEGFFGTESGQALIAAVGALVALAVRSATRWLNDKIKRTPTKIDDKIRKAVRDELHGKQEGR
jgi:ABC-type transport system involved in cytochrome bd biosynthesis fused ATPase/permease subunit